MGGSLPAAVGLLPPHDQWLAILHQEEQNCVHGLVSPLPQPNLFSGSQGLEAPKNLQAQKGGARKRKDPKGVGLQKASLEQEVPSENVAAT